MKYQIFVCLNGRWRIFEGTTTNLEKRIQERISRIIFPFFSKTHHCISFPSILLPSHYLLAGILFSVIRRIFSFVHWNFSQSVKLDSALSYSNDTVKFPLVDITHCVKARMIEWNFHWSKLINRLIGLKWKTWCTYRFNFNFATAILIVRWRKI